MPTGGGAVRTRTGQADRFFCSSVALALLLVFLCSCTGVEKIMPLLYPEGDLPDPKEAWSTSGEPLLPPVPSYPAPERWTRRDLERAARASGLDPTHFDERAHRSFTEIQTLAIQDSEMASCRSLQEAYAVLARRGTPLVLSSDLVADRTAAILGALHDHLEEQRIASTLGHLLREMTRSSLEQYHYSVGDLKEAAWRNTVFLSVACRLLDSDAPTPFVASGLVRQELDRIASAEGPAPSPLLSLDRGAPRGGNVLDYSIFANHPFVRLHPGSATLHRTLLWLSEIPFSLGEKYPLLQAILLTDGLKRAQIREGARKWPAAQDWYQICRFYEFSHRTTTDILPRHMDETLKEAMPQGFDENYFLDPAQLIAQEKRSPALSRLRRHIFRLFPSWDEPFAPYFRPLVYPEIGPDPNHPLYRDFLLRGLDLRCAPHPGYVPSHPLHSSAEGLSTDDNRYLFCNALNLAFRNPDVLGVFRTLPSAEDLAVMVGWPARAPFRPFMRYADHLDTLRSNFARKPDTPPACSPEEALLAARDLLPDRHPVPRLASSRPWSAVFRTQALGILATSVPSPPDRRPGPLWQTRSFVFEDLEPNPRRFARMLDTLDLVRRNMVLLGLAQPELDDALLQYGGILRELRNLSLHHADGSSLQPDERTWLRQAGALLDDSEYRILKALDPKPEALRETPYPRHSTLGSCASTHMRVLGLYGGFRLVAVGLRTAGGPRLGAFPQAAYFELEASTQRGFSRDELYNLILQGIPRLVSDPSGD